MADHISHMRSFSSGFRLNRGRLVAKNTTTCLGLVDHLLLFLGHSTNVGVPRDSVGFIAARYGKVDLAVAGK
jgi:hypothetical protein